MMQVKVSGYAASGGGRGIERVDISIDGGKNWVEASRYQKDGISYVAGDICSDKWAWVLFEATVDIPRDTVIVAKAVCCFLDVAKLVAAPPLSLSKPRNSL